MSRIGKNPVEVPDGVDLAIAGQQVTAKGKLGELSSVLTDDVDVSREENLVWVKPRGNSIRARKMWGTARSVINNLVVGVSEGYSRNLEINGVGYRAQIQGNELVMQLGFSHEVRHGVPEGITIKCPDQTHITVEGADKQKVGQTASEIRAYRPPEPYKGKGIKYADEYILRKEGKKK
ncbi:MAG TPA: 50S ribosomal protein L6 [Rhodospirillales bacterium]|nr:50S ribosomal protein L6 [Rhodospirillales bacterium]